MKSTIPIPLFLALLSRSSSAFRSMGIFLRNRNNQRSSIRMNLYDRIRTAALRKFKDGDVERVIECWDEFSKGNVLERYIDDCPSTTKTDIVTIKDDRVFQRADCYVKGLTAKCFFDPDEYSWSKGLGERYKDILRELQKYESKQVQQMISEGQTWLPPRDTSGNAYGPEWRTLGLQDRSVWDEEKLQDFPLTVGLLKDLKVPSCEVFFAKQGVFSFSTTVSDLAAKKAYLSTALLIVTKPSLTVAQCYDTCTS